MVAKNAVRPFPSTHWTVVTAAAETNDSDAAELALAELCRSYWTPLYSFVRSRGYGVHDAQDLTQSFFAFFLEAKIYARADRRRGRFRSFLLASLRNFLADTADREQTLKRGGGQTVVPLDEKQAREAEKLFQRNEAFGEDRVFDRTWADALLAAAMERLSADYATEAKRKLFHQLLPFIAGGAEPPPSYAELAVRFGMTQSTMRSHVTRLRARYREALHAEVRRTVASESEMEEELRELMRVLAES